MRKKWIAIGIGVISLALVGYGMNGKARGSCQTCSQKEAPFFQLFSMPSPDPVARKKKILSFVNQSYSLFRVAMTPEEAADPDVQAIMQKFPDRFTKLPDGYRLQELLYRWLHSVPASDIIVFFPSNEGLDPSALSRLQILYSASAVWLAFQGDIKNWAYNGILTGYARLFQKIKLQDFLEHGAFSENCNPENRLFELAGRHVRRLHGNFTEGENYGYRWIARSKKPYPNLRQKKRTATFASDLVIFSHNHPMQLFALLESIDQFVTSIHQITVIYTTSSPTYEEGYTIVKKKFPHANYLKQGEDPARDFKPLVLKATFQSSSPYVIFATDDMVVYDSVNIQEAITQMERAGALGVYYCLGRHIDFSYKKNQPQSIPPSIRLGNDMWAWQFSAAEGDWKQQFSLDMILYRKEDIKPALTSLKYTHPSAMESKWAAKAKSNSVGLYYDTSKAVHIPLDVANSADPQTTSPYTSEELLRMFLAGLKLDIQSMLLNKTVSFIAQEEAK